MCFPVDLCVTPVPLSVKRFFSALAWALRVFLCDLGVLGVKGLG